MDTDSDDDLFGSTTDSEDGDEASGLQFCGEAKHIDANLYCRESSFSLPDRHLIRGNLDLGSCENCCETLISLPDGLAVSGDLDLRGLSALTSLGDGLRVDGNLDLAYCKALTSLPNRLNVSGHLNLYGCEALQERHRYDMGAFFVQLSAALGAEAGLSLAGWDAVELVPDNFIIRNLDLAYCKALTSLGGGLNVSGDLKLYECSALTSLSNSLSVSGDLDLHDCKALTSLGDGLRVSGILDLKGCMALASLPDGLDVSGHLDLGWCSALQERHRDDMGAFFVQLSAVLGPKSGLSLSQWGAVEQVPGDFIIGNLDLAYCEALTSLGDGLNVSGDLNLYRCSALTSLGGGLNVSGELNLQGCSALISLPNGLTVSGDLNLGGCEALTSLPRLNVSGELNLCGCSALISLPVGLTVSGKINLEDCKALTGLPEGLSVGGDLKLLGCSALTSLPGGLIVSGDLDLRGCSALTRLPYGLSVSGRLDLDHCEALTSLPGCLIVRGNLDLRGCLALTSLPDGPRVGRDLKLRGCSALTSLGNRLRVSGDLDLQDCSALESLPASILEWPLRENGDRHNIYLDGSGLSQETLDWLREADAPAIQFHVNLVASSGSASQGFASAEEAVAFWAEQAGVESAGVQASSYGADTATVVEFLSRLRSAKDFGISERETRKALAKRVINVLMLLGKEPLAREEVITRMADSLDASGDKLVWALDQMHLVEDIAKARESAEQLRDLGRRVMRLMVMHDHAKRKVDSLSWVDDVCVYLRFEIDLREALNLPVAATAMIFPSYIKIEEEELEAAKEAALGITENEFEAWLEEWPEWQRLLRRDLVDMLKSSGWSSLQALDSRQSPSKRRRLNLSSDQMEDAATLRNVSGEPMEDPVTLDGGKSVWSLSDLLSHWKRTGFDLENGPVSVEQLRSKLKRVAA